MSETSGTLTLKIARVEQRLKILEQQCVMSQTYPQHQARLTAEETRLRQELGQLVEKQQKLLLLPLAI